jgi:ribose transport system substrate-binding protein
MDRKYRTLFAGAAAVALAVSSVGSALAQDESMAPAESMAAGGGYTIGVSNTLQGNGWREEMICSIRAQAAASGRVDRLIVAHRTTDAAGQLEDLRNLIAAGVNAIIVNPASPDAVNAALQEALDQGIVVVAVDQGVNLPGTYLVSNDQVEYGRLGGQWLAEKIGGSGNVVYMRGIAGAQADTDRDTGFRAAMAEYPDIQIISETFTGWDPATGAQQIADVFAGGQQIDGIWTSGIDSTIVDAFKAAGREFVPIVGADNALFVQQMVDDAPNGLVAAAVTNTASVGGAGVTVAIEALDGASPETQLINAPQLWDNTTEEGQAAAKDHIDPTLDALWPVTWEVPGFTTYTKDELKACKGPGEE